MTIWRPQQIVQVKALGLIWRDGRLLADEVYSDDGSLKGVRPPGGRIEFGESWQDALLREFREEFAAEIEISSQPRFMENIYTHHGVLGHEIVFLADVRFLSPEQEQAERFEYVEDNGFRCCARWFALDELDAGGIELYPTGLMSLLRSAQSAVERRPP